MIPILFEHNETEFLSQGIGRLKDCISNTVTEERNGIFECEFVYPFFSKMYSEITEGRIIYCTHDETEIPQPFDIYAHSAPIDGKVTFYARHITYRQNRMVVMPFSASSVAEAMVKIKANSATTNPFTYWTDKSTTANFELSEPRSIRAVLGGQEGSLLDVFGTGEYEWDKFTIKLHQNRGTDSGVEIRYGKNLVDLTDEIDTGSSYNAVVPYWLPNSDDATIVTLPEKVLVYNGSEFVSIENATISGVVAMDLSSEFQNQPTVSQLRDRAKSMLVSSKAWEARRNISVDFVALWQTEEYKDVAPLQRVRLCDTVSVFYPELGVEAVKQKVVKTVWNVLLDRYDKIELGDSTYSYSEVITEGLFEDVPTTSFMESAINRATNRITGGRGGHIRMNFNADGDPDEILVMDSTDMDQAVKLWRWNLGGLGYSEDGYDGPYGTAITMDGEIVADYITTGSLNAARVNAGILTDQQGRNYWNLDTGEFSLTGYATEQSLATLRSDLEQQVDGKINTFYQQADPSTNWTSAEKTAHTGDLWFRTTDAKTLRWNGSSWQEQSVSNAVSNAIASKSTIYYGSASGTYSGVSTGDYLVDNTTGSTFKWDGSSWVKQTDYASAITTAISGLRSDLETQIDGKINTFYQSSDPSTSWTSTQKSAHTGDLWYDTDDQKTYRWNGTAWQQQNVPTAVFDEIDGKSTIFYGTTSETYTGVETGDYLVDSTTGSTYRWTGSAWSKVTDYTTAISNYDTSLNQQAVFNKLTNNSQNEGVYLSNGHLYVNASMVKTGEFDATLIKAGILQSQDSNVAFSVNMLTGAIIMKDATLTGGSLTTQNGSYKNVTYNGYTYFYYGNEYVGKIGTSLFGQEQAMAIDIGGDAEYGGFAINESGTATAAMSLYYSRSADKWTSTKPLVVKNGSNSVTLSPDTNNDLTMNDIKVASQTWVNSQGFLKTADFSQYATMDWVDDNYVTLTEFNGYLPKYVGIQQYTGGTTTPRYTGVVPTKLNYGGSFTSTGGLNMTDAPMSSNNPYWGNTGMETSHIQFIVPQTINSNGQITKWAEVSVYTVNGFVESMGVDQDNTGAINWIYNARNPRFPVPT